jgi:hypothetical protein
MTIKNILNSIIVLNKLNTLINYYTNYNIIYISQEVNKEA